MYVFIYALVHRAACKCIQILMQIFYLSSGYESKDNLEFVSLSLSIGGEFFLLLSMELEPEIKSGPEPNP